MPKTEGTPPMPDNAKSAKQALPAIMLFAVGLVAIGALRWAAANLESFAQFASVPTPAFVVLTVVVLLRIVRGPIGWSGIGIGQPFRPVAHLALGILGAAAIVAAGQLLEPVWLELFGETRNLSRFDSATTLPGLLWFLLLSWTFAAVGEELAFRGVLMRGLSMALGGGTGPVILALLIQAVVFGFAHAYQGPAGIAATMISALIFGTVVIMARGSLWPAMLAHGLANSVGLIWLYVGNS